MKKSILILLILNSIIFLYPVIAIPAFPGAEGFGSSAIGGRGGDIYFVTNLNDSGIGSFRYGLDSMQNPRTILFNLSGTIELKSNLVIKKPFLTIAGQTAPGDGITIKNYPLVIEADNIIIRNIRSRLGNKSGQYDAISIQLGNNIIIDHCSASWGVDETLSATGRINNLTIQWSFITESLNKFLNQENHGYGSLFRTYNDANFSIHHNFYADHYGRVPRPGSYNGAILTLDFRNNLIYNWVGANGFDNFTKEYLNMNYVNNYLIAGPSTKNLSMIFNSDSINIYQNGNILIPNDKLVTYPKNQTILGKYTSVNSPFEVDNISTESAESAKNNILKYAGATPWNRDSVDKRIIEQVMNNSGKIINDVESNAWPNLTSNNPEKDSDLDGMPDYWEDSMKLNSTLKDNNKLNSEGYTNLEVYINSLVSKQNTTKKNSLFDNIKNTMCHRHLYFGCSRNIKFLDIIKVLNWLIN